MRAPEKKRLTSVEPVSKRKKSFEYQFKVSEKFGSFIFYQLELIASARFILLN